MTPEQERRLITEWLRKFARKDRDVPNASAARVALQNAANSIERGEHLKPTGGQD